MLNQVENKHEGPFSIDQLPEQGLSPDDMVWKEGMQNWVKASEMPELQIFFQEPPPPPPVAPPNPQMPYNAPQGAAPQGYQQPQQQYRAPQPKGAGARNVFRIIFAVIFSLIALVGLAGIISSNDAGAWVLFLIFAMCAIFLFLAKPKKAGRGKMDSKDVMTGMTMAHMMNMDDYSSNDGGDFDFGD